MLKAYRTLDCRGLLCPMPIIRIAQAIREIQIGQILEMLAGDPGSKADMEAWARQTGHEILKIRQKGKTLKFYVRRAK